MSGVDLVRAGLDLTQSSLAGLVAALPDVTFLIDFDGTVLWCSRPALLRSCPTPAGLADVVHPDDLRAVHTRLAEWAARPGPGTPVEFRMRSDDGDWHAVEAKATNVLDTPGLDGIVVSARDVAARLAERETLSRQAWHDPLTGLPNRALLLDRLGMALARARRRRSLLGILFLDLDRFKPVNDQMGHAAGDALLVAVATRLRAAVRPSDTVARLGGDEFVVLCEDIADETAALGVAGRVMASLSQPIGVSGVDVTLSASIGIALADTWHNHPEALLRDADAAMYLAKEAGRNRVEIFDASARARAAYRIDTERALKRALAQSEMQVFYQPQISADSGRVVGVEALVRWVSDGRILAPATFIPVAEETGMILDIGEWVLRQACEQAAAWLAAGIGPLLLTVNVSGRQLERGGFPWVVAGALAESGLDPGLLCLEITESTLMGDGDTLHGTLQELKALGVCLGIDDFGTGYSSLARLRRLPVDVLKIDRSFVDGLGESAEDSAIVAAIVNLAHSLGLSVIAEGVETPRQLAELRALGCNVAQGFFFAAPAPADTIGKLMRSEKWLRRKLRMADAARPLEAGIGLHTVRTLVEAIGGEVEAAPRPDGRRDVSVRMLPAGPGARSALEEAKPGVGDRSMIREFMRQIGVRVEPRDGEDR